METKDTMVTMVTQVKNTPFAIAENNGKFIIVCNNAVITERTFNTKEAAVKYIGTKPWELIINAACYCMSLSKKLQDNEKGN